MQARSWKTDLGDWGGAVGDTPSSAHRVLADQTNLTPQQSMYGSPYSQHKDGQQLVLAGGGSGQRASDYVPNAGTSHIAPLSLRRSTKGGTPRGKSESLAPQREGSMAATPSSQSAAVRQSMASRIGTLRSQLGVVATTSARATDQAYYGWVSVEGCDMGCNALDVIEALQRFGRVVQHVVPAPSGHSSAGILAPVMHVQFESIQSATAAVNKGTVRVKRHTTANDAPTGANAVRPRAQREMAVLRPDIVVEVNQCSHGALKAMQAPKPDAPSRYEEALRQRMMASSSGGLRRMRPHHFVLDFAVNIVMWVVGLLMWLLGKQRNNQ